MDCFCWWGHWSLLHCFPNSLRGTEASGWKGKPHFNSYKSTNAGRLCHQSEEKWPINQEVDLHKSVWWYRNYDHIFQLFSRYPNSFRTRFHYQHQKVAVSTANVSCFIGEKSLICICLMSLGSKQTNNMHRIEAYHICDWNGIKWILLLFPKNRLKSGYLKYNSHPKKRL